jgi:putative Ig domain-containing protein
MNLPPNFTTIGGQSVADTTARVFFTMLEGQAYSFTIEASDPADPVSDPLAYTAHYQQLGMAFTPSTRTFSWTPPSGTAGQTFHVKFMATTASGGTDAIIAVISVVLGFGSGSRATLAPPVVSPLSEGDGLVRFQFQGAVPKVAELAIYDLAGRCLARTVANGTDGLRWDGRDSGGRSLVSGIYFYRIRTGDATLSGKLVYLR